MTPSLAGRPARLRADALPRWRSNSVARSMSPPDSSRARLQSIIPATVDSLRALTCSAEILGWSVMTSLARSRLAWTGVRLRLGGDLGPRGPGPRGRGGAGFDL